MINKKDLIQPCQNEFKLHYPKQWRKNEAAQEKFEIKQKNEKKSREEYYKKYKNTLHGEAAREICRREDPSIPKRRYI